MLRPPWHSNVWYRQKKDVGRVSRSYLNRLCLGAELSCSTAWVQAKLKPNPFIKGSLHPSRSEIYRKGTRWQNKEINKYFYIGFLHHVLPQRTNGSSKVKYRFLKLLSSILRRQAAGNQTCNIFDVTFKTKVDIYEINNHNHRMHIKQCTLYKYGRMLGRHLWS